MKIVEEKCVEEVVFLEIVFPEKIITEQNDPNMTLNASRSKYPIHVKLLRASPKFNSISLYDHSFPT